ncbi:MAG: hypothetical protein PHD53_12430 [Methylococcales bacterium]|nr:hypothetical protein [Methylococcales bacterium]
MTVYSTKEQLEKIAHYLIAYMRIPYFQDDTVPGKIMEKIFSLVHDAELLDTYDYVDVCIKNKVGWQIKSTKSTTPVTWKRAKIANAIELIKQSEESEAGCQQLGNAIIEFCNSHAKESLAAYNLSEIGYSRLIMFPDNTVVYFERLIASKNNPDIFDKNDFVWHWSNPKNTVKKEQLSALHGVDVKTGKKAFAWHGRGENQLHFSSENDWWPEIEKPTKIGQIEFSKDFHAMAFKLSTEKVSWDDLVSFLNRSS